MLTFKFEFGMQARQAALPPSITREKSVTADSLINAIVFWPAAAVARAAEVGLLRRELLAPGRKALDHWRQHRYALQHR